MFVGLLRHTYSLTCRASCTARSSTSARPTANSLMKVRHYL